MDEDRLARGRGYLHLSDEGGAAGWGCGVVDVVVVEADLADGNHPLVCCQPRQLGQRVGVGPVRLLGMDSGAGEDCGRGWLACELLGDLQRALHLAGPLADADGEDGAHAGGFGAGKHQGQAAGEHVEVRVRVGQVHGIQGSRFMVQGEV